MKYDIKELEKEAHISLSKKTKETLDDWYNKDYDINTIISLSEKQLNWIDSLLYKRSLGGVNDEEVLRVVKLLNIK